METPLIHYFVPRTADQQLTLEDRFCRPGAGFGPASVERTMGVTRVYHEHAERTRGGYKCPVCGAVATD